MPAILGSCGASVLTKGIPWPNASSLRVWLAARNEEYAHDDAVGQLSDFSGRGNHATQATAASKPTFKKNVINGLPALYFVNDDFLQFEDVFRGMSAAEVFLVLQRDVDPASSASTNLNAGFWRMNAATGANVASHVPWTDGNIYDGCFSTVRKGAGNPTPSLASPRIYNVTSMSGEWTCRIDGTQQFTTATNTYQSPTTGNQGMATLGRSSGEVVNNFWYYAGHFAEFLVYDQKLSSAARDEVEGILGGLYNITVA